MGGLGYVGHDPGLLGSWPGGALGGGLHVPPVHAACVDLPPAPDYHPRQDSPAEVNAVCFRSLGKSQADGTTAATLWSFIFYFCASSIPSG